MLRRRIAPHLWRRSARVWARWVTLRARLAIEYRWANFKLDQLPSLTADLVRRQVKAIATPVSTSASLAAKSGTTTIPIIFGIGTDPVKAGLVTRFNRPGGNITGIVGLNWELGAK